jgi:hypothetical protein
MFTVMSATQGGNDSICFRIFFLKKARRSAYSLLGGGFHGHNGLDVDNSTFIQNIHISGTPLRIKPPLGHTSIVCD